MRRSPEQSPKHHLGLVSREFDATCPTHPSKSSTRSSSSFIYTLAQTTTNDTHTLHINESGTK